MERRRFLVSGCGRSGTGYTSALLTRLGADCGHEVLFEVERLERDVPPDWPEDVWGESSWLAAPFLERLPAGTVVLHQVRHPLAVVRSFARQNFFGRRHPWRSFAVRHCPEFEEHPPLAACFLYWLRWNELVQRAETLPGLSYFRYRIEDVDDVLARVLREIGCAPPVEQVARELGALSRTHNTAGDRCVDWRVGWDYFADHPGMEPLLELAHAYGYDALAASA